MSTPSGVVIVPMLSLLWHPRWRGPPADQPSLRRVPGSARPATTRLPASGNGELLAGCNARRARCGQYRLACPQMPGLRHGSEAESMRRRRRPAGAASQEIVIGLPGHEVYRFSRDFTNVPRFLGDVVAVRQLTGVRYRWVVAGPRGIRIPMTIVVTEERTDRLLRYRSAGPPLLRGRWELSFAEGRGVRGTRVRERLSVPLGPVGRAVLRWAGKFPEQEVAANLASLKRLLEAGQQKVAPR